MAQSNAAVAARFAYTGTVGGYQERATRRILNQVIELGKLIEATLADGTEKTTLMTDLDTLVTDIHAGGAKLDDTKDKGKSH